MVAHRPAQGVVQNIAGALAGIRVPGITQSVTASFGVAALPDHGVSVETLLRSADRALYRAKRDGRNCIPMADSEPAPDREDVTPPAPPFARRDTTRPR